ncbi:MAG: HAD-IA family hydrolase [Lachnoclostridium sp.]|nr:HAD-IA family hydrolase [Lachnoclostridium sp.]
MICTNISPDTFIWLDLDDTLIDFHGNSRLALRQLWEDCRLDRWYDAPEQWIDNYEVSNIDLWRRYALDEVTKDYLRLERMRAPLRPCWKGTPEALDAFAAELDPLYLDRLAEQKGLVPGALELLDALRQRGFRTGILSNGFKQVQYRKMDTTGITPYIDIVVLSDDIGVNKPALPIYRHAMQQAGVTDPALNLMIGDNLTTDIGGAINAGWQAILLDPASPEPLSHSTSHTTVNSLAALLSLLPG